ncbi:MAG: PAS domain-containing protein [Bacteroidota bacterium]|nr:PAS domain-containing protein [Bacteroidota bacterium]MDP4211034.1 PAS domain-containing protein [Bacteroidota bacterium]MDP4248744.1 PAS domain-containing protein [Bacteroidota bacterium]
MSGNGDNKFISKASDLLEIGHGNGYSGRPISEFISNGFFTVDQNWMVTYWNRAAEKITGIPSNKIVGENLWKEWDGILPTKLFELYPNAFSENIPAHFQENWGEMGSWSDVISYHCENTLSVSFKDGNQAISAENPELQLKALNQLYRFVTEISNDCLWEWDLQRKEMFWIDGGHKRVFGYPIENALIPQSFWENLLHPDDRERISKKISKITTEEMGSVWGDEYRFRKANGDYAYVCDRGHIIYDEDRLASRIIGATQDISSTKIAEIKLLDERLAAHKELACAISTARQNERAEIGKVLHENLSQILCAAKLQPCRTI